MQGPQTTAGGNAGYAGYIAGQKSQLRLLPLLSLVRLGFVAG